jgi:hypothetical protein
MAFKISNKTVMSFDKTYENDGLLALIDKVNIYNNKTTTKYPVSYKYCIACCCDTPYIEDTCFACGRDN